MTADLAAQHEACARLCRAIAAHMQSHKWDYDYGINSLDKILGDVEVPGRDGVNQLNCIVSAMTVRPVGVITPVGYIDWSNLHDWLMERVLHDSVMASLHAMSFVRSYHPDADHALIKKWFRSELIDKWFRDRSPWFTPERRPYLEGLNYYHRFWWDHRHLTLIDVVDTATKWGQTTQDDINKWTTAAMLRMTDHDSERHIAEMTLAEFEERLRLLLPR